MTTERPQAGQPPALKKEHLRRLACPNAMQRASCPAQSEASDSEWQSPLSSDGPSSGSVLDFPTSLKSAKRKAREDLLNSRFARVGSTSSLPGAAASPTMHAVAITTDGSKRLRPNPSSRPPVLVPACDSCACHVHKQQQGGTGGAWCSCDVSIPAMDWTAALQPITGGDSLSSDSSGLYLLPGGIEVRIVSRVEQVPAALRVLRRSMRDSCVAIDLEWRPDCYTGKGSGPTSSRVALLQLASATLCLLVRCSRLPTLPPCLVDFLSDPSITLVGYSWDGADQAKLSATYGFGRERFARFHDLQQVSEQLGYHGYGLSALTQQVLGFELPKSRKVTMSNWEAWQLSPQQIQYAALDAITTGHVFRALRQWHASPSACASCRQLLGTAFGKPKWCCLTCRRAFDSLPAAASHMRSKQHVGSWAQCGECGRASASE